MEEAKVIATIKLEFTTTGDLPYAIQNGYMDEAYSLAHSMVENVIDCCGYAGEHMLIEDVAFELKR